MIDIAVDVDAITKTFGDRTALDAVAFSVQPAEIFGLLGPNGGGKSTLFRILSTLLAPTKGSARILGLDVVNNEAGVRGRIGVVFQAPSLDKKLSVRENLMHQGHLYGLRGAELNARIDDLLARFGLTDRAADTVQVLSGGLARRVEIAKGMIHKPQVLLLDEPSTGLDPGARLEMWKQLENIRQQDGVTVLLTTHIMEEADKCDRLALLHEGKLVALGAPRELKAQIPGEVVMLFGPKPEEISRRLREEFQLESKILGASVRLETADGHALSAKLAGVFGDALQAVTVGKPTLEDVFMAKTGSRFWNE